MQFFASLWAKHQTRPLASDHNSHVCLPSSFLLWDLPEYDPDPGSPAELRRHGAGIAVPHRHGIFLFCSGLLWIDPSCLLEIHTQHGACRGPVCLSSQYHLQDGEMASALAGRGIQRHPSSSLTRNPKLAKSSRHQLVEDSMMDVYDFVYEEVRRNTSSFRRHELTAIHEAFLCCGKHSPFGDTTNVENKMCPPGQVHNEGQVYGMILTSFLWFSIHFSSNLYRKGKYILRER
ncbi:tetraspanin-32 isoform X3 [Cinclus cinclus]|uniref:tetraspanin-32 isoform X3 n=1 Tax=Cinclus cinclus TaxID=127875 RepID=UPI002E12C61C